jgi:hypothetical protein
LVTTAIVRLRADNLLVEQDRICALAARQRVATIRNGKAANVTRISTSISSPPGLPSAFAIS